MNIFCYLMKLFNVSGKEMALQLGVDTAVVSKWKNGKRKIPKNSGYNYEIASFFLSDRFEVFFNEIYSLLEQYVDDIENKDKAQQIKILADVLERECTKSGTEAAINRKSEYNAQLKVFDGAGDGWYKAVLGYMEQLSSEKSTSDVILGDFGAINWDEIDREYYMKMYEHIGNLVEGGRKFIILDLPKDSYRSYQIIFRWLPIYMYPLVEVYNVNDVDLVKEKRFVMTTDNGSALVGKHFENAKNIKIFDIYNDYLNVSYYHEKNKYYLSKSRRMVELIHLRNTFSSIEYLEKDLQKGTKAFLMNPVPTFFNMPVDLLMKILEDNGITGSSAARITSITKWRNNLRKQYSGIQIYNLDKIEESFQKEYYVAPMLSKILEREIIVKKEYLAEQFRFILKQMDENDYTVYLPSYKEDIPDAQTNLSFTVQEDRMVMCWDELKYDYMVHSKEVTLVGGFCEYMRNLIDEIPPIKKNKEWTKSTIKKIVNKLSIINAK